MSSTEALSKFQGRFKLERSENFDEYLASKGVNWFLRKMIGFASVTKVFRPEDDGRWTLQNLSSKKNTTHQWKLGEEFEAEGLDGKQHRIRFDLTDGALNEHHVRLDDPTDKGETYHYTIDGDYLVLAMQNDVVACKRWFKREPETSNISQ
ncbi:unnamed protein product, partial [Mesorhabditis spiculigera]